MGVPVRLFGWQEIPLDPKTRTVQLIVPGMRLDLGGIAKGYAGDCAIAALKKHGITRALVEAGGDIVVSGRRPAVPAGRSSSSRRETADGSGDGPQQHLRSWPAVRYATTGRSTLHGGQRGDRDANPSS